MTRANPGPVPLLAALVCLLGCSEEAGGSGSERDAGNQGSGAVDVECINEGQENQLCPAKEPQLGSCAPKGVCCHRASNARKEQELGPDDPLVLEYRLNSALTANFPMTLSFPTIITLNEQRADLEQQSTLWRFILPREDGQEVSGLGTVVLGYGRYNCDGTYSFYGDEAAPVRENCPTCSQDRARWLPHEIPIEVDVTKTGRERFKIAFEDDPGREHTYLPFVNADTFELDWELVFQSFDLLTIDLSEETRDCMGERVGLRAWIPGGTFEVYTPLGVNSHERVSSIMRTYCQLAAFGLFEDPPECGDEVERCTPEAVHDEAGCPWVALPDSLCPVTSDQKASWGCHLGAMGNPNLDPAYPSDADLRCSDDAPTGVLDPAQTDERGQCCDPLAESATLPACNAYRLVQEYAAAAAEITDEPVDELQQRCP